MIIKKTDLVFCDISNIKWDFDDIEGEEPLLPCGMNVQFNFWDKGIGTEIGEDEYEVTRVEIEDFIGDWLSDEYGFCHKGYDLKYAKPKGAH